MSDETLEHLKKMTPEIEYIDPKMGVITIHLKRLGYTPGDQELYDIIQLLVKVLNNHAMEINKLKGMEVNPKDYEVYI